ncbi:MAG: hypothetical protein ACRDH0_09995 [Actinomycetota bacterium]
MRKTLTFMIAFLIFVLGSVIQQNPASAATCWTASRTYTQFPNLFSVTLKADPYCGDGRHFTKAITWKRSYTESAVWSFNKWFPRVVSSGTGTSPSGRTNVEWRQRQQLAEFKTCYTVCLHSSPHGVQIRVYADGWWTSSVQ